MLLLMSIWNELILYIKDIIYIHNISIINSNFGIVSKAGSNIKTIFGHKSGGVLCMRDKMGSKLANPREYHLELTQRTQVWILRDLGQDLTPSQGGPPYGGAPVAALYG